MLITLLEKPNLVPSLLLSLGIALKNATHPSSPPDLEIPQITPLCRHIGLTIAPDNIWRGSLGEEQKLVSESPATMTELPAWSMI